ncbi:hypothetical protein MED92_00785 [Neptuniibacter caesariensis]|uniref:Uncharacterized protein n=1 Tax=Neptuniibacter caesariensis TaxID=207954 RepID=A0A7U8C247_NEPCE|nr:hypothetical protein MED92_00785 [Neptuniibacter caesariensis]
MASISGKDGIEALGQARKDYGSQRWECIKDDALPQPLKAPANHPQFKQSAP